MSYIKYKNPIVFGRGPRSFEVTRGESPKNVRTRYLKIESLDVFHSCCTFFCISFHYAFGSDADIKMLNFINMHSGRSFMWFCLKKLVDVISQ